MKTHRILAAVAAAGLLAGGQMWGGQAAAAAAPEAATAAAGDHASVKLALGEAAPEIDATGLDGKAVTLASLAGKPVVLQFGSLTDPIFRGRVADSEKLAGKYGDKATFVVVYQREAHPADGPDAVEVNVDAGFAITKPVNQAQRVNLAGQAVERLKIKNQRLVVDAWSDASSLRYGSYPNMTFVVDAAGKLQAGYPWMDPAKVTGALDALVAGKPVPAEFKGKTTAAAPGQLDYTSSQAMGGNRGAGLAVIMDHLKLTDQQKLALYPALGEYLAEARDFREKHGALAAGPGGPGGLRRPGAQPGTAPGAGAPAAPAATTDGVKAESPEEFQKALESLRATAQKLKTAVKENLPEKDAKELLDVLDQGPAKRLFAD